LPNVSLAKGKCCLANASDMRGRLARLASELAADRASIARLDAQKLLRVAGFVADVREAVVFVRPVNALTSVDAQIRLERRGSRRAGLWRGAWRARSERARDTRRAWTGRSRRASALVASVHRAVPRPSDPHSFLVETAPGCAGLARGAVRTARAEVGPGRRVRGTVPSGVARAAVADFKGFGPGPIRRCLRRWLRRELEPRREPGRSAPAAQRAASRPRARVAPHRLPD
jgi:hypothetical protein